MFSPTSQSSNIFAPCLYLQSPPISPTAHGSHYFHEPLIHDSFSRLMSSSPTSSHLFNSHVNLTFGDPDTTIMTSATQLSSRAQWITMTALSQPLMSHSESIAFMHQDYTNSSFHNVHRAVCELLKVLNESIGYLFHPTCYLSPMCSYIICFICIVCSMVYVLYQSDY